MELKELLEIGVQKTGSVTALATAITLTPQQITNARAHRAGIPVTACFQLADLIGEDPAAVVAASELVTEKKPERRAVLLPFAMRHAAVITLTAAVTLLLTPTAAKAAPVLEFAQRAIGIMLNCE